MTETQGDRIIKIMEHFHLNQEELAGVLEITQEGVSKMITRGTVSKKVLNKLGESYKINKRWLLTGEGEMLSNEEKPATKNEGGVFLSAAALYTMWQDSEKKAREERKSMIEVMLTLSERIKEKDALLEALLAERPKASSKTAG